MSFFYELKYFDNVWFTEKMLRIWKYLAEY